MHIDLLEQLKDSLDFLTLMYNSKMASHMKHTLVCIVSFEKLFRIL